MVTISARPCSDSRKNCNPVGVPLPPPPPPHLSFFLEILAC